MDIPESLGKVVVWAAGLPTAPKILLSLVALALTTLFLTLIWAPPKKTQKSVPLSDARRARLIEIARTSPEQQERDRALAALFPPANASKASLDLSTDPMMTIFRIGELALQGKPTDAARFIPALTQIVNDEDQPVRLREEAAHSVAKIGGTAASKALLSVLASPATPPSLRVTALHGPMRFWEEGDTRDAFEESAFLIIGTWSSTTCSTLITQERYKYLPEDFRNAIELCAAQGQ